MVYMCMASSTTAAFRLSKMLSWSLLILALSIKVMNCSFRTSQPTSTHLTPNWFSAHCFNLMSTVVLNVPENLDDENIYYNDKYGATVDLIKIGNNGFSNLT